MVLFSIILILIIAYFIWATILHKKKKNEQKISTTQSHKKQYKKSPFYTETHVSSDGVTEMSINISEEGLKELYNKIVSEDINIKEDIFDIANVYGKKRVSENKDYTVVYGHSDLSYKIVLLKNEKVLFKKSFYQVNDCCVNNNGVVIANAQLTSSGYRGRLICFDVNGREMFYKKLQIVVDDVWFEQEPNLVGYRNINNRVMWLDINTEKITMSK